MVQSVSRSAVQRFSSWVGRLEIADGWARWQGSSGDGGWHRHVAAQIVSGLDGFVEVECAAGALRAQTLLIEPLAKHRVMAGHRVALVFIEPWALRAGVTLPAIFSCSGLVQGCPVVSEVPEHSQGFWSAWRAAGRSGPAGPSVSVWAERARRQIDAQLDGDPGDPISLARLARELGVGSDHARHRFAAEFGLPFKRYVLWQRLRRAGLALQRGAGATASAHEAGFADAAHLARTLKAMFGVRFSQLR